MLFISKGRKFFCSRENNFMSGASRADWNRWKVHCLELKGRKKRSLGWREDFEKVGEGRPGKLISYCVYSPQNPVCLLLFWTNLPIEIEPLRWSAASMNEGFPGGSDRKEYTCKAGDPGSVPGWGKFPRGGNSYLLQYSCLENSMDREAWLATIPIPPNFHQSVKIYFCYNGIYHGNKAHKVEMRCVCVCETVWSKQMYNTSEFLILCSIIARASPAPQQVNLPALQEMQEPQCGPGLGRCPGELLPFYALLV